MGSRRNEIARAVERGIVRGDLRPGADPDTAIDLLVGPIYFRVMFGGELTLEFANEVVNGYLAAFGTASVAGRAARLGSTIAIW